MRRWWLVAAALLVAVAGAAVWSGWTHSDDPTGPPALSLRDVIRQRGGAPGSVPP